LSGPIASAETMVEQLVCLAAWSDSDWNGEGGGDDGGQA
jgi:hypothetical protein